MKIYYAHCINIYNSLQEKRDIELIKLLFKNSIIYNPSSDEKANEGYKKEGMDYFFNIIKDCDILIFRALPHGKIPAGVYNEIQIAIECSLPIIEFPCYTDRKMSVEDTRTYLRECGCR